MTALPTAPTAPFALKAARISAIVPDGRAQCVCIAVAHPSKLYITRSGIVTHNTTVTEQTPQQRQFAETEAALGGKPAYEQAKAAGKTKLNYGQWVQVRTPNFKAWFGDWEAVQVQNKLDAMKPIALNLPDSLRGASIAELRNAVKARLDALAEAATKANNPDIGEVGFSKGNNKKVASTSATPEKLHAAHDIVSVIEQAIHVNSLTSGKENESRHGVRYHTLAARVEAFGRPFTTIVTIKQSEDGQRYYNNIAVEPANEKSPVAYQGERASGEVGSATAFTGDSSSVLQIMRRVNPESVSKVTDPDTGEPMVVYHGGHRLDGNAFKTDNGFGGIFTNPDYEMAGEYAQQYSEKDGVIYPLFINAKNPVHEDDLTGRTQPELIASAKAAGHDAAWLDATTRRNGKAQYPSLVFFNPIQAKLATPDLYVDGTSFWGHEIVATGNSGAFDGTNPDIRYSRSELWTKRSPQAEPWSKATGQGGMRLDLSEKQTPVHCSR